MNIRTKDILACLPLLASVLGDRYGVTIKIGGNIACTNGPVIQIPSLPLDSDAETLELVKGYTDHESAHIRHTDFEAMRKANFSRAEKIIFNALEDWRVEQRLSAIFPGCRTNLNRLIRKFFVEDEEAGAGENPALAVMNYVLLSVRSWEVPEVRSNRDKTGKVVDASYTGLVAKINEILERVKIACPDTQAAITYAREIVKLINQWEAKHQKSVNSPKWHEKDAKLDKFTSKKEKNRDSHNSRGEPQNERGQNPNPTVTTESTETKPEQQSSSSRDKEENETDSPAPLSKSDENGLKEHLDNPVNSIRQGALANSSMQNPEGEDANSTLQAGGILEQISESELEKLSKGIGEIIANELAHKKEGSPNQGIEVAVSGKVWERHLPLHEKQEAMQKSAALRARLAGLLQAQMLRHCLPARWGKLRTPNLYRLTIGNPKVFAREEPKAGVNTAIHILLDRSGSMSGKRIIIARQSCYAVAKALSLIRGINVGVSAFPEERESDTGEGIVPLVRHGELVGENFGIHCAGGTPLASALWWVLQTLAAQKEPRKMAIILTDGYPDNLPTAKTAISQFRKLGMEIYAIGINTDAVTRLEVNNSKVIRELAELPVALFGLLKDALVKGDGHASAH